MNDWFKWLVMLLGFALAVIAIVKLVPYVVT